MGRLTLNTQNNAVTEEACLQQMTNHMKQHHGKVSHHHHQIRVVQAKAPMDTSCPLSNLSSSVNLNAGSEQCNPKGEQSEVRAAGKAGKGGRGRKGRSKAVGKDSKGKARRGEPDFDWTEAGNEPGDGSSGCGAGARSMGGN